MTKSIRSKKEERFQNSGVARSRPGASRAHRPRACDPLYLTVRFQWAVWTISESSNALSISHACLFAQSPPQTTPPVSSHSPKPLSGRISGKSRSRLCLCAAEGIAMSATVRDSLSLNSKRPLESQRALSSETLFCKKFFLQKESPKTPGVFFFFSSHNDEGVVVERERESGATAPATLDLKEDCSEAPFCEKRLLCQTPSFRILSESSFHALSYVRQVVETPAGLLRGQSGSVGESSTVRSLLRACARRAPL